MDKILAKLFFISILSMPLYLARVSLFGFPTNVFELIVSATLLIWIIKERQKLLGYFLELPKSISLSIFLILLGLLASMLANGVTQNGLGIIKSWFVLPILFGFAMFSRLKSIREIEKTILAIYFSTLIVAIISIYYKLTGILTFDGRLQGFYGSPNYLAMFLSPGTLIGIYFLTKELNSIYPKKLFLILTSLVMILWPFYLTYSYSAWIAVFFALLIMLKLSLPTTKKPIWVFSLILISFILVLAQTASPKFSNLINVSSRSSIASRGMIWRSAGLILSDSPLAGIGPGNFQAAYLDYQKYFPPYLEWAAPQPHNIFLAFWLQTGLIGLLGFLFLLFNILKFLWQSAKNKKTAPISAVLIAFFVYTLIHGLVDTPYWKNDLAFLFWIFVFLALSLLKTKPSEIQKPRA